MTQIKIKRVYEDPEAEDGYRVLVDRLWPRGMKKGYLKYDVWEKDITPSPELGNGFMKIWQDIGRLSQICIGKNWKHLKPHGTFWHQSNPIKQLLCYMPPKNLSVIMPAFCNSFWKPALGNREYSLSLQQSSPQKSRTA